MAKEKSQNGQAPQVMTTQRLIKNIEKTFSNEKEKEEEEAKSIIEKIDKEQVMKELSQKIKEEAETIKEEEDESSSGSDSAQSEDNLDAEDLIKLMPKKVTKTKIGNKKRKTAAQAPPHIPKKPMYD